MQAKCTCDWCYETKSILVLNEIRFDTTRSICDYHRSEVAVENDGLFLHTSSRLPNKSEFQRGPDRHEFDEWSRRVVTRRRLLFNGFPEAIFRQCITFSSKQSEFSYDGRKSLSIVSILFADGSFLRVLFQFRFEIADPTFSSVAMGHLNVPPYRRRRRTAVAEHRGSRVNFTIPYFLSCSLSLSLSTGVPV